MAKTTKAAARKKFKATIAKAKKLHKSHPKMKWQTCVSKAAKK